MCVMCLYVCVCVDVSALQGHSQPMPCFAFAHKEKQIVYAVSLKLRCYTWSFLLHNTYIIVERREERGWDEKR